MPSPVKNGASHENTPSQRSARISAEVLRRLADEYDAAQERGEVDKPADSLRQGPVVPFENNGKPTVTDLGLTRKQVHEARQVRDAEAVAPGVVRRALDERRQAACECAATGRKRRRIYIGAGAVRSTFLPSQSDAECFNMDLIKQLADWCISERKSLCEGLDLMERKILRTHEQSSSGVQKETTENTKADYRRKIAEIDDLIVKINSDHPGLI